MPIYEYKCQECGHEFELLLIPGKDGSKPGCPECGSSELKKLISSPFLPSDVGKPANEEPASCCGSNPDNNECTPGSCCGEE